MALEDRLNQLEDEFKVLKNQIQNTLLDIREYLLSTTYPSLYSLQVNGEEGDQTHNQAPGRPLQRFNPQTDISKKYKTNKVVLNEDGLDEEDLYDPDPPPARTEKPAKPDQELKAGRPADVLDPPTPLSTNGHNGHAVPLPTVDFEVDDLLDEELELQLADLSRELEEQNNQLDKLEESFSKISDRISTNRILNDGQQITPELLSEMMQDEMPFLPDSDSSIDAFEAQMIRETVCRIMSWIDESIGLIGKDRTVQAIQIYGKGGHISNEMAQAMLRLVHDSEQDIDAGNKPSVILVINTLSNLNDILEEFSQEHLHEGINLISEVHLG